MNLESAGVLLTQPWLLVMRLSENFPFLPLLPISQQGFYLYCQKFCSILLLSPSITKLTSNDGYLPI